MLSPATLCAMLCRCLAGCQLCNGLDAVACAALSDEEQVAEDPEVRPLPNVAC